MTQQEAIAVLQEFYDYNKTLTPHGESWLQADITINRYTQEELGKALPTAIAALREKAERERGCAYCVIGKRSPDAEYCSNCGRKLTPTLPELANESEEVNQDSRQYLDNDSTYRRKSVKQMGRNLYSETAETCTLRCEYCGKYTQDSDLSTEWVGDKYLMCSKCKEKHT
jgi:hypothetical protein